MQKEVPKYSEVSFGSDKSLTTETHVDIIELNENETKELENGGNYKEHARGDSPCWASADNVRQILREQRRKSSSRRKIIQESRGRSNIDYASREYNVLSKRRTDK